MYQKTKEVELIKTAILNEKEGEMFYSLAAEKSENPDVKKAFLFLAKEETEHRNWLESIYRKLIQEKQITLEEMFESEAHSPEIFTEATKYPEKGSLEVSVFGIGAKMEKASMDFYQKAAENSDVPELQDFYRKLIKWEEKHLIMLEKIYDQLKVEWWETQGFDPA